MFLSWKITDDISNITVEEFNKEYNGLYGFIKLKIGDYSIGYIPENNVLLDGNSDILYYIKKLIECGINICKKDVIEVPLLSHNLLKLCVQYNKDENIWVELKMVEDNSIVWRSELSFNQLINEINSNYNNICNFIEKYNSKLFKTDLIKSIIILHNTLHELLSQ